MDRIAERSGQRPHVNDGAGERRYLSEGSMAKLYHTSHTEPVAAIKSSDV